MSKKLIFFDEFNHGMARRGVSQLADNLNQLVDMLAVHHIEVGLEAMREYMTGTDAIARAILQKQNEELAGMPELVRSRMLVPVDLTAEDKLLRDMEFSLRTFLTAQQQAGRKLGKPIDFCEYIGGRYVINEEALRLHFTVFSSERIDSIVNQARAIEIAFNYLSDECREVGIKVLGDNNGILQLDIDKKKLSINMGATRYIS